MRFKHLSLLPLLLALLPQAPAQTAAQPTPQKTEPVAQSSALSSALFYQLLLGELNARNEEPASAFSLMLDAAHQTKDPALFNRAVQIALQARSGPSALMAAQAWAKAEPQSREANRFVLQVLLGLNRTAEALEPLKRDIALTPKTAQQEAIWRIASLFERVSDRPLAANTVQKALASYLGSVALGPTAWATIGRMWHSADQASTALKAAASGLRMNAKAEHPALLALTLMSANTPSAEELVKKHLPHARPEFRISYVKVLISAQRDADASVQLALLQKNHPDYADSWLISGALKLQMNQPQQAQAQLQHYLDLTEPSASPSDVEAHARGRTQAFFALAQIAQQSKDYKQADDWLLRITTPEDTTRAEIRRAQLVAEQGQLDAALGMLQNLPTRSAEEQQLKQAAQVQLLKDGKQFERARALLQTQLNHNPTDPDLIYELAMVQEKLGQLDDMERLLRQLIEARPNDPHAYNALGYSLADRGLRLPEAIALITRALELAPNDPFILDSLAWAEFRSGNADKALQQLQTAFKAKPDAEIAAHLGEVLWHLKRQDEARDIWREGIKLNPANETLLQTVQRLKAVL